MNISKETHDLVARVQYDGGCNHDMDVSEFMDDFLEKGAEYVKRLIEDDRTYCSFVRLEEKGTWTMM